MSYFSNPYFFYATGNQFQLLAELCSIYLIVPKGMFVLLDCLILNFRHSLLISFIHACPLHTHTHPSLYPILPVYFYVIILIRLDLMFIFLWLLKHNSELSLVNYDCFLFLYRFYVFYVANKLFFLFQFLFISISAFTKFAKRFCFLHFIVSVSLECLSHHFLPL